MFKGHIWSSWQGCGALGRRTDCPSLGVPLSSTLQFQACTLNHLYPHHARLYHCFLIIALQTINQAPPSTQERVTQLTFSPLPLPPNLVGGWGSLLTSTQHSPPHLAGG